MKSTKYFSQIIIDTDADFDFLPPTGGVPLRVRRKSNERLDHVAC